MPEAAVRNRPPEPRTLGYGLGVSPLPRPLAPRPLTLLAVLLGCALAAGATWHNTPTFDEPRHLAMGRQILLQGDWSRLDNSKMPVSVLNALPSLWTGDPGGAPAAWFPLRLPSVAWLGATAWLAGRWAAHLFGPWAGLAVAATVAWEPNLLAHAGLATTDLPAAFFVLAVLYSTWAALQAPSGRAWSLAGASLGLALASKFTCTFLVPILLLAVPVAQVARACRRSTPVVQPKPRAAHRVRNLAVWALSAILALNLAYGFQGTFTRADHFRWQSEAFSALATLPVPLPAPAPWVEGVDWVRADDERGHGNVYAAGSLTPDGRPGWFLEVASWKLSLPFLALSLLGVAWPRRRGTHDLFLLWPATFFLLWLSLAFNFQIGFRYLLPVLPLLAVSMGRLHPALVLAGAGLTMLGALPWFPHLLAYQNVRLANRVDAWRNVADSNLDWGQEGLARDRWLVDHPDGLVDPDVPAPGPMLVSANHLVGVTGDPARMACLRDHLPPTDHIAFTWYPYDLRPDDLEPCFPRVNWEPGPGTWTFRSAGGSHVVVARVRGDATLQAGTSPPVVHASTGAGEALLGLILDVREGPVALSTTGHVLGLYVDGRPIPGVSPEDR